MDFYDSTFYADTRRAMRLHILKTVRDSIVVAASYFFLLIFIYLFLNFLNIQWVYWTFSSVLLAAFVYFKMRMGIKKRDKLIFQFKSMTEDELTYMDNKYDKMEPEFDTLFFFDNYIYFPDEMLFIPYDDIADIKAEFPNIKVKHIPVYLGALLKIRCKSGAKYSVKIKDSKSFRDYHMTIYSSISERKGKRAQAVKAYRPVDSDVLKTAADHTSAEITSKLCGLAFRHKTLKIAAWDILIFSMYVLAAFTYFTIVQKNDLFLPFIAVSAAADAIFLITAVIWLSAKREKMAVRTDKFSAADFNAIKQGQAMFGTFFMLDNCIWFFRENMSLDYSDIEKASAVRLFLRRIPDGVRLDIHLKSGKKCRIRVKNWFEYQTYEEIFLTDLNEKLSKNNFQEV